MIRWIDRILMTALVIVVGLLAATALPFLSGKPLEGDILLMHMLVSGALVIGLPILAIAFLRYLLPSTLTSPSEILASDPEIEGPKNSRFGRSVFQFGYLTTVLTGLLTIATVFACMLPVPSTEQMHTLIWAHGWAGFAMIPGVLFLLIGMTSRN